MNSMFFQQNEVKSCYIFFIISFHFKIKKVRNNIYVTAAFVGTVLNIPHDVYRANVREHCSFFAIAVGGWLLRRKSSCSSSINNNSNTKRWKSKILEQLFVSFAFILQLLKKWRGSGLGGTEQMYFCCSLLFSASHIGCFFSAAVLAWGILSERVFDLVLYLVISFKFRN